MHLQKKQVTDKDGLITKINISEEEVKSLPEKEAAMAAQMIADNMDYSEDDIYIERYKKELEAIQPVSDTTRAYLLVNIVEDNDKESWGYGEKVKTEEDFLERYKALTVGIKSLPYVCGYCYTQLSDVQQEKNGFLTEERRFKVNPEKIKSN